MADTFVDDLSSMNISKLKVPDLKKELKTRGLSTSGNKNELVERLQAALKSNDSILSDPIDDIEEDLLNDDDDDHMDERESLIHELDQTLDESPKSQKRKLELDGKTEAVGGPPKKVILKRNTSETLASVVPNTTTVNTTNSIEDTDNDTTFDTVQDKKVIKLSELSVKERLEMRAKKFGITVLSDDAKKLARAERFGGLSANGTSSSSAASIKENNTSASLDVLKQRAARFGTSVSNVLTDLEKQEKLKKRQERFGISIDATKTDPELAKAARLERFKTTVK